jgi:hypothetical protein
MPLRMGRGERNYPDYAVEPNPRRGEESATFLIETKYEIATKHWTWQEIEHPDRFHELAAELGNGRLTSRRRRARAHAPRATPEPVSGGE